LMNGHQDSEDAAISPMMATSSKHFVREMNFFMLLVPHLITDFMYLLSLFHIL